MRVYCDKGKLNRILHGNSFIPERYFVPLWKTPVAVHRYIRMIFIYKKNGFKGAIQYLKSVHPHSKAQESVSVQQLYSARQAMLIFRLIGKLFHEDWNCLEQACTLMVALASMGYSTKIVIGKFLYHASESFDFHAWVELGEFIVNDTESVYERCEPIWKYSIEKE